MIEWQWLIIASILGLGLGACIGFALFVSFTRERTPISRHVQDLSDRDLPED